MKSTHCGFPNHTFLYFSVLKVEKGAFKGLKTDKMTIKLNKKMPKKQSAKFKKALKKAGFKGTIK